ncbi:hypothetical protein FIBSPDRAFT_736642 [Athelia psychrophila]|uniref:C2H2-type domain-containing protein n=1 Tax=Athelia psychrophila TaxID=1759441 RepID=A0A166MBM8_9AGAM|nr:hypothetical protein FIBSPDRAFT_736788 [Fibularhizoctonia sp. CBS 109695]KZP23838.1 hypothetical protein FIBSPDRAFT_736642 [Fibularhizoctonia sp. CBS 109695]
MSKPSVTTGQAANTSRIRRKQDANFESPVPGCGSTFTRSFNLKGHIRSHDEKHFQCKWPGCGKEFARQHDCKRHEQLHSNYRLFTCDGCNKNFAQMDALNRHRKCHSKHISCVILIYVQFYRKVEWIAKKFCTGRGTTARHRTMALVCSPNKTISPAGRRTLARM